MPTTLPYNLIFRLKVLGGISISNLNRSQCVHSHKCYRYRPGFRLSASSDIQVHGTLRQQWSKKAEYNVETKCIVADFTETEGVYEHIEKQLTGLEIGILINNVGVSFSYPEYFLEVPDKEILYERIIKANVVAVTRMCGIVMPGMVERRKGLVINLSSAAALMPAPLFAVYAASKMYVDKLTEDLASSYSRHGLIIQSVLPGPVATKMSKIYRATWMAPSPDDFVKSALNTCGKSDATTGYHPHDLLVGAVKGITAICPAAAVWLVTKTTENIRRRALKKISSSSL